MNKFFKWATRFFKWVFILFGILSIVFIILAFTTVPYKVSQWLATHDSKPSFEPEIIVMLGGSGMPSEDNLIRLYYTAYFSNIFEPSMIFIAHPYDSSVYVKMRDELMIRNVDSSLVIFTCGTNTRSQALGIKKRISGLAYSKIAIVTSPEYMYRSVMVFRKIGFKNVCGYQALGNAMNTDLTFKSKKLGGRKIIPDIGENLSVRYNFWNYLKLEINCLREFAAIAYYKLNNWI